MNSLPNRSAPVKPQGSTAGEREYLIHALRAAVSHSRLITHTLESIGVALRHNAVDCDGAMKWLAEEGVRQLVQFGPKGGAE